MGRNIVIYQDEGVGEFGLACLVRFFGRDAVRFADAAAVIDANILDGADIFVMPGGADLPYCRALNGAGNAAIRRFVEKGGTYLGLCAGAYYGCRALEFHKGRADEITGGRELAFANATACGSLHALAKPYDLTLRSAAVTRILLPSGESVPVFYHGGPAFRLDAGHGNNGNAAPHIAGRYLELENAPPAIIESRAGQGRAILCGVHPEVTADDLGQYPLEDAQDAPIRAVLAAQLSGADPHALLRSLLKRS
ncbi:MAG: BPL-N domain-containing protein [Micavibrio sp.]